MDARKIVDAESAKEADLTAADPVVWLFPGLGSRFVGMGSDLFGRHASAEELITTAQQVLNYDIAEVCLSGSGRKVVPARVEAQVIYVINCAYADVLRDCGAQADILCGHSLGTWAAAYAAGAIDFETGLKLVTSVEDLLERMIVPDEQSMGVVIGLPEETVTTLCRDETEVYLANRNSPGQSVISGSTAGVEAVLAKAAELSARQAKRIAGSRAMHSPLLHDVDSEIQKVLDTVTINDTRAALWDCHQVRPLRQSDEIRAYLGNFLSQPVEWERSMRALGAMGAAQFLEVGAAAILTGMMPFIDQSYPVETASDWLSRTESAIPIHLTHPV